MRFPIVATMTILRKNGKVLLIKRGHTPFKGKWALPGGHVERYEAIEKSARREVKEETGLSVKKLKYHGLNEELFPKFKWHAVALVYSCSDFTGKVKPIDTNEIKVAGWFSKDQLKKMSLAFNHKKVLKDILKF